MKYMCLAFGDRAKMEALSKKEGDVLLENCMGYMAELKKTGRLVIDMALAWESTMIRPKNGKVSVVDGPFTESKEQVGGVFMIEARDLNEAILVASNHPAAHLGEHLGWGIEVRPVDHFEEAQNT
jgi:hypothetical protein